MPSATCILRKTISLLVSLLPDTHDIGSFFKIVTRSKLLTVSLEAHMCAVTP